MLFIIFIYILSFPESKPSLYRPAHLQIITVKIMISGPTQCQISLNTGDEFWFGLVQIRRRRRRGKTPSTRKKPREEPGSLGETPPPEGWGDLLLLQATWRETTEQKSHAHLWCSPSYLPGLDHVMGPAGPAIPRLLYIWEQTQNTELVDFTIKKWLWTHSLGKQFNSNNIRVSLTWGCDSVVLPVYGRRGCRRSADAAHRQRPRLSVWPLSHCSRASGQQGHPALHLDARRHSRSVLRGDKSLLVQVCSHVEVLNLIEDYRVWQSDFSVWLSYLRFLRSRDGWSHSPDCTNHQPEHS